MSKRIKKEGMNRRGIKGILRPRSKGIGKRENKWKEKIEMNGS